MRRDETGEHDAHRHHDGRRRFLQQAAGFAGVTAAGFTSVEAHAAHAVKDGAPTLTTGGGHGTAPSVPFHGLHQAGIVTPQQSFAAFIAFDVLTEDREELVELFKTLTERARLLVRGRKPKDASVAAEPKTQDALTITVGVGASLFDDRFGLAPRRPRFLTAMPEFPGDVLDPESCHGDVSLQICARHPDAVVHVIRDIARHTNGKLRPRWRADGFLNPARPSGASRTFVGFKDGIVHPDTKSSKEMDRLVWVKPSSGEPAWAQDGSYQVIRLIRFHVEAWDRVPIAAQEKIFGRHKASGAPLDGRREADLPNYRKDPQGKKIPLNAHIRLANPRTAETADSLLLRRSYNYDRGFDTDGSLDLGLAFCCYQQNVVRQFAAIQRRLAGEPLAEFVSPTGGGYFFALPGVRNASDWFGSTLLKT
ncbi:iron uptake transporter deferrochelatase/peroxidase subunit [Streptomyces sp. NPDC002994]|uniref:iron uptake transporter deferrochelatase/peroxidase subunit n=1 Tax=Streptomyces sp. NPDC002994 TaxID=3154441 RepID=UPI0033BAA650